MGKAIRLLARCAVAAALLPLVAAVLPTAASSARAADAVDELIEDRRKAMRTPAVSVAVVKDGKVVKAKGYGLATVDPPRPATEKTVYQIGSLTKQFTAVAVLMLVEEGKVGLDDPIRKHLDGLPAAWDKVTVRHLLSHTSGIFSYTSADKFTDTPRNVYAPRDLIALAADKPLNFAPGTDWDYSNTGYVLLGLLIEKASGGKPYGVFVRERIFAPLGMKDTGFNDPKAKIAGRAAGYTLKDDKVAVSEPVDPSQPYAAGALLSTVVDLAKWDAALGSEKLLKPATWELAWTPVTVNGGEKRDYGFGWSVDTFRDRKRVHHGGGINGFVSYMTRFPQEKLTVIVLTNSEVSDPNGIATAVAAAYVPALKPAEVKVVEDSDPALTKRLRGVVESLVRGDAKPEEFTDEMRRRLFPDKVKEVRGVLGSLGPLKAFDLVESAEKDGVRVRVYRAAFVRAGLRAQFALAPDGKIAGLLLRPEE